MLFPLVSLSGLIEPHSSIELHAFLPTIFPMPQPQFSGGELINQEQAASLPDQMAGEQRLRNYYAAIANRRYADAYAMLSDRYQSQVPSPQFIRQYRDYIVNLSVQSVQLLSTLSTNNQLLYHVSFDVAYLRPYPSSDGRLQEYYRLVPDPDQPGNWLIDSMETAP